MLSLHVICSNSCPHTSSSVYTSSLCFLYLVSLLIIKADYMVFYTYFILQYYCLNNAYIFFSFFLIFVLYYAPISIFAVSLCIYSFPRSLYSLHHSSVCIISLYPPLDLYTVISSSFFFFRLSDRIWLNRTRTNNPFTRG